MIVTLATGLHATTTVFVSNKNMSYIIIINLLLRGLLLLFRDDGMINRHGLHTQPVMSFERHGCRSTSGLEPSRGLK